jgi:parallel beta-helix repeat protein
MTSYTLSPVWGAGAQLFDNSGNVLTGGKIETYAAGTTTPAVTYTDPIGNFFNSNPIIADASGRLSNEIWLLVGSAYKFVLKDANNVLIATYDNIPSSPQPPVTNDASSISYEQGYTVTAGAFTVGATYRITSVGTTNFVAIGAAANAIGILFTATGVGSGNGTAEYSRTVQAKLRETVSVKDFGATGDGVTDDTTAIQNAVNTACRVFFPNGTYLTNSINIPSNTALIGETIGGVIITANGVITEPGLFQTTTTTKVEIANFTFSAMFSSYATLSAIFMNSSTFAYVHDVYINAANYGINTVNATSNSTFERITVNNANNIGIVIAGTNSFRNKVLNCTVNTTTISHAIQIQGGAYSEVSNCKCSGAKIFGISLYQTEFAIASNNTIVDTLAEGINVEDASNCTVSDNNISWTNNAISTDFGLSLFAPPPLETANFNIITGNFINGSNKSGIALAEDCAYNTVSNNTVVNPNFLNEVQGSGILIYGSGGGNNLITGNTIFANNSKMRHGISDNNAVDGLSSGSNIINNNSITGFTISAVSKVATTTQALNTTGYLSYTPIIASSSGTITSYTSEGFYYEIGKMVFFTLSAVITNNGTGSASLTATLPFPNSTTQTTVSGRENGVTGYTLNGIIGASSNTVNVTTYINSYPASTGANVIVTGFYARA